VSELIVVLHLLSALSLFERLWGLALLFALACAAHLAFDGRGAYQAWRRDRDAAWTALSKVGRPEQVVLGMGIFIATLRLLRSLIAPPMGQDSIVYHLLRAGRWVQSGQIGWESAPDVWRFIEAYPPAGDALPAWAMLATHSDSFVGIASAVPWAICWIGAYALARTMGGTTRGAAVAAGLVALCPAVSVYLTSAYNDALVLAMFLAGATFGARASKSTARIDFFLCGLAFGIAASIKITALVWLAIALIFILGRAAFVRPRSASLAAALGLLTLGASVAGLGMARAFAHTGSPVYPFGLKLLWIDWPRDELFELVTSARLFGPTDYLPTWHLPKMLFYPGLWKGRDETGLGPTVLLLLPATIAGAKIAWRQATSRTALLVATISSLVLVLGLAMPGMTAYRTGFAIHLGRLVTVAAATISILATVNNSKWARWLCLLGLSINAVLGLPRGWCQLDASAFASLAPSLLAIAAPAVALTSFVRRLSQWARRVAVGALIGVSTLGWIGVAHERSSFRYAYYEKAATGTCFDVHVLTRQHAAAWPVWRGLDGVVRRRIAASGGWDGLAGFWARYPLLGESLQNEVIYLPPSKDGKVIDYRLADSQASRFDFGAWITRMADQKVDVFVSMFPPAPEHQWVVRHPEIFEPMLQSADRKTTAYRFHREILSQDPNAFATDRGM